MKTFLLFLLVTTTIFSQEKVHIAVLDLDNRSEFTADEIKLFTDRINAEIANYDDFIVVERQQINAILNEQGFQQSGACNNQECLIEVGQLLSVQKIIGGSIGKMENIFPVSLKIIDVTTGKIDAQIVRDCKGSKTKLLSEYFPEITYDLIQKAGYGKNVQQYSKKKKKLIARPVFWIPTIAVLGGGAAAAAIILSKEDDGGDITDGGIGEIDISDFPNHDIGGTR